MRSVWKRFARHQCNLAAKERRLECACVDNDDFIVLVSEVIEGACVLCGHHIQNDWAIKQGICIKFCVKLQHCSGEAIQIIQKAAAMGNWWLAASSWQCTCSCTLSCAEFFGKTSSHPSDSVPWQPRCRALWLLAFPKTKLTFERGEISERQWVSGK